MISEHLYCDFVCWTPAGLHIERIEYDDELVSEMVTRLDKFFINVILPNFCVEQIVVKKHTLMISSVFVVVRTIRKDDRM